MSWKGEVQANGGGEVIDMTVYCWRVLSTGAYGRLDAYILPVQRLQSLGTVYGKKTSRVARS